MIIARQHGRTAYTVLRSVAIARIGKRVFIACLDHQRKHIAKEVRRLGQYARVCKGGVRLWKSSQEEGKL